MGFVFINRSHYMDLRRAFNFLFQVLPNVSRYDPRTENNELITPRKPIFHSTCHSFYPNYKQDYYSVLFVFLQCIDQFLKSFKVMHMVRRIIPHNDLKSAVTIAMLTTSVWFWYFDELHHSSIFYIFNITSICQVVSLI